MRHADLSLGRPTGGIYGVGSGALGISIAPGEGGPCLAHLGTSGYWIGEGPFLTGEPRRVDLVAMSQCVLLNLPLHVMERMPAEDPMNIRRFAQIASSNVDLALRVIGDLMIAQPERRIAAVLVRSVGTQQRPMARLRRLNLVGWQTPRAS